MAGYSLEINDFPEGAESFGIFINGKKLEVHSLEIHSPPGDTKATIICSAPLRSGLRLGSTGSLCLEGESLDLRLLRVEARGWEDDIVYFSFVPLEIIFNGSLIGLTKYQQA